MYTEKYELGSSLLKKILLTKCAGWKNQSINLCLIFIVIIVLI